MKKLPRSSKLPCAFCQGRGIQPRTERLSCIVCKGSGHFTVKQPYNICKECGGKGKKKGATLYCLPCHGKGFVEEKRYPLAVESPAQKTKIKKRKRRKGEIRKRKLINKSKKKITSKKLVTPPPKADHPRAEKVRKEKVIVKKERKSFFKKFLGTLKIL